MNLTDVLKLKGIKVDCKGEGKDKVDIIYEMIDLLCSANRLKKFHKEVLQDVILRREKQKSTGMEKGIAIPHGKTEHIKGLIGALGIYKDGVSFDSQDKKPTHFIVIMASDFENSDEHIKALAHTVRLFQEDEFAEKILKSETPKQVFEILREKEKLFEAANS